MIPVSQHQCEETCVMAVLDVLSCQLRKQSNRFLLAAFAFFVSCVVVSTALAQVPGTNVNMVLGTTWPSGDPFAQRQNEPSMAVSSRNPQHLLAGSNDYRTVDIAFTDPSSSFSGELGDAWLSVYTSLDGGDNWSSTLLPGYPQDTSSVGMNSPLHGFKAATDPTVRAGTHGLFYYSGLV